MDDKELKQLNAVYDEPSRYDYLWSDYVEGADPKKFCEGFKLKVWNQYDFKDTYKACSVYGLNYIYNGYQLKEYKEFGADFEQEDPRRKWLVFQAGRGYPNSGASLQEVMKFFKNSGYIDGYVLAKTAQECKNAIKNGFGIYTGSGECSWSEANKQKKFVYDANGANHCFAIVDYDDNGLIAINSFGEKWGDEGYFYIPDDCYNYLFSTYAIIDHDDSGQLDKLRYNMEYQKAVELGITNGTRPDEPATRRETAVMVYRACKNILNS